jgi:hypothetical protein
MSFVKFALFAGVLVVGLIGCGDSKTVIPNAPFTDEQKKAIQAEDAKIADEESHGQNKRKK